MGYYDSVKDNVKGDGDGDSSVSGASFDTLKEKAENSSEDEENGDDTQIEVLEEGGLNKSSETGSQSSAGGNSMTGSSSGSVSRDTDLSSLEQKLDKIIEQNQRMIEVLESFGS